MRPDEEGERWQSQAPEYDNSEDLDIMREPLRFPTELIQEILELDPNLKVYLDALPDLVQEGIELIVIREGKVVEDVGKSDDARQFCKLGFRLLHSDGVDGAEPITEWSVFREVNARDLVRFRYYYFPEEEPNV